MCALYAHVHNIEIEHKLCRFNSIRLLGYFYTFFLSVVARWFGNSLKNIYNYVNDRVGYEMTGIIYVWLCMQIIYKCFFFLSFFISLFLRAGRLVIENTWIQTPYIILSESNGKGKMYDYTKMSNLLNRRQICSVFILLCAIQFCLIFHVMCGRFVSTAFVVNEKIRTNKPIAYQLKKSPFFTGNRVTHYVRNGVNQILKKLPSSFSFNIKATKLFMDKHNLFKVYSLNFWSVFSLSFYFPSFDFAPI